MVLVVHSHAQRTQRNVLNGNALTIIRDELYFSFSTSEWCGSGVCVMPSGAVMRESESTERTGKSPATTRHVNSLLE